MKNPALVCAIFASIFAISAGVFAQDSPDLDRWPGYQLTKIVDIGPGERESPAAIAFGGSERYRAVGAVLCRGAKSTPQRPYDIRHTATLIENRLTVVTDAHTMLNEAGGLLTAKKNCAFNVYDINGDVIDTSLLKIVRGTANGASLENISGPHSGNDWLVVTLETEIKKAMPFKIARGNSSIDVNDAIQLCSFSYDLKLKVNPKGDYIKRCLRGRYRNEGRDDPFYGTSAVFLHDIPTSGMSSGAPVFLDLHKADAPKLYGIHVGGGIPDKATGHGVCKSLDKNYHVTLCSNVGIFFNNEFHAVLASAIRQTGGSIYESEKL